MQKIHCINDVEECKSVLSSKGYNDLLAYVDKAPLPSEEKKMADGSIALYRDGKLVGFKGKRIYTVEEAEKVSKKTGNTFRLRYK